MMDEMNVACRSVRTDQSDEVVPAQHRREILEEDAAGYFHRQPFDGDHSVATAVGDLELERHRPRLARRRRESRQTFQALALALRLK